MIDLHREFVVQHNAQCDAEQPIPDSVIVQVRWLRLALWSPFTSPGSCIRVVAAVVAIGYASDDE